MTLLRQLPSMGLRAVAAIVGLSVLVGIIIAFSGALDRSTEVEAQAERIRAETALMQAQVEAGEAEIEFVESDDFVRWQARALELGKAGEQPFALPPDAPQPEPIVPIGPHTGEQDPAAPFDAWMEMLFGP